MVLDLLEEFIDTLTIAFEALYIVLKELNILTKLVKKVTGTSTSSLFYSI